MAGDLRIQPFQMPPVSKAAFESLRLLDTCSVSNAIERFDVRLGNEGIASGAVTARVRPSSAPMKKGDRNGIPIIPREIAEDMPDMARRIQEKDLIQFCRSGAVSPKQLSDRTQPVSTDALVHVPGLKP
jgi:hypothetical protein